MNIEIQSPREINVKILNNGVGLDNNAKVYRGLSAYEIAVKNGFDGSEEEWLESLKGKDGYTPQKGIDYFTVKDKEELVEETKTLVKELIQPKLDDNLNDAKKYTDDLIGYINDELSTLTTVGGV